MAKKYDPWPGKHNKVVRTNAYDPYKIENEKLMYGRENNCSTGLYQYSVYKNFNQLLQPNGLSSSLSSSSKRAVNNDGLILSDSKSLRTQSFTKFSKFGYLDPYNRAPGQTKEVLFFTKPDLHIVNPDNKKKLASGLADAPFFIDLLDKYPDVIKELQYSYQNNTCPFMHILHNRVRDTLDLPDISSNDIDISANMYGNDYTYRGSSEPSDDQFTFNLEFEDDKYLDIYMLFRAYEEYERYKKLGLVLPLRRYVNRKVLHDQISIYKFTLSDDFTTIIHYAKLWGCYPTGLPRSVFSSTDFSSSGLTLSIPWKCAFVEDMNPLILTDFNMAMKDYKNKDKISLILNNGRINRTDWASGAYVVEERIASEVPSSRYVYKLEWRK